MPKFTKVYILVDNDLGDILGVFTSASRAEDFGWEHLHSNYDTPSYEAGDELEDWGLSLTGHDVITES